MMNNNLLFNEVSEAIERIIATNIQAKVSFTIEDGMTTIEFKHIDKRYAEGHRSIYLFDFQCNHKLRAWHYQLDKVFEGGLLDEI